MTATAEKAAAAAPVLRRKRRLQQHNRSYSSRLLLRHSPLLRHHHHDFRQAEPFYVTFLKVGSTLLVLSISFYVVVFSKVSLLFVAPSHDQDAYLKALREYRLTTIPPKTMVNVAVQDEEETGKGDTLSAIIRSFPLGDAARHDAFGIAEEYLSVQTLITTERRDDSSLHRFLQVAQKLREQFADAYGGETVARALLERCLKTTFTTTTTTTDNERNSNNGGVVQLAARIRQARTSGKGVFRMAFGGQAATAGYGNYFHQSFPFVVEHLLTEAFDSLGLSLSVRNAAMEGISTFPYTWCLENYMGQDVDFLSWDFAPTSTESLEAFLRTVATIGNPVVLFRDSFKAAERQSLIESYVKMGVLMDPFVVDVGQAAEPFRNVRASALPTGLQGWKDFAAPPGAPGKVRQNLTLKQHELFGWIVTMHLLSAMELVAADELSPSSLVSWPSLDGAIIPELPDPVSKSFNLDATPILDWRSLLFRVGPSKFGKTVCRTSFDPVVSGSLADVIESGSAGEDVDLLHPKGAMYYHKGWVLGLEPADRREKLLMKQWDNLGFVDLKKAYFGVKASGPLRLRIPLDDDPNDAPASAFFRSLIICESHVPSGTEGCSLERDAIFTIGGVEAADVEVIDNDAVTFAGKRICVHIKVPVGATLSSLDVENDQNKQPLGQDHRREKSVSNFGMAVDIAVKSETVMWNKGPCSIAQVIWEITDKSSS